LVFLAAMSFCLRYAAEFAGSGASPTVDRGNVGRKADRHNQTAIQSVMTAA